MIRFWRRAAPTATEPVRERPQDYTWGSLEERREAIERVRLRTAQVREEIELRKAMDELAELSPVRVVAPPPAPAAAGPGDPDRPDEPDPTPDQTWTGGRRATVGDMASDLRTVGGLDWSGKRIRNRYGIGHDRAEEVRAEAARSG